MEKISVLIPTFNREKFITLALESIQRQTYKDLDIIVYDDGSSDGTVRIVRERQKKDSRIKLIVNEKNVGCPHARNKLIEACETRYAAWQDSDDFSNIYRIQFQYDVIKEENCCVQCARPCSTIIDPEAWLKSPQQQGLTTGFATLMFPVFKDILFKPYVKFGSDLIWLEEMHKRLGRGNILVSQELYYVNFHSDRIGSWKRKLKPMFTDEEKARLSYEEMINIYEERQRNK